MQENGRLMAGSIDVYGETPYMFHAYWGGGGGPERSKEEDRNVRAQASQFLTRAGGKKNKQ